MSLLSSFLSSQRDKSLFVDAVGIKARKVATI